MAEGAGIFGGFWRRLAAALVDAILLLIPLAVTGVVLSLLTGPLSPVSRGFDLAALFVPWLYYAAFEAAGAGATPGKRAFGLRVTDLNGRRLSFLGATGRFAGKILSLLSLGLGFGMSAVTRRKQALHDYVASALVVDASASTEDIERLSGYPLSPVARLMLTAGVVALPFAVGAAALYAPRYWPQIQAWAGWS